MYGIANEPSKTPLESALHTGIDSISENQQIVFQQYNKYVMPADNTVFWIKNQNPSALFSGSFHFSTDKRQEVDQTIGVNRALLTAKEEITELNQSNPQTAWIGNVITPSGQSIKVCFSERGNFYEQAGVWHYRGDAIYPPMYSQIIDSEEDLPNSPVVSNSLPIWLSLNQFSNVYSSFLVPDNIQPPYIAVHIDPAKTVALGAFPLIKNKGTLTPPNTYQFETWQLMEDNVELIMYGFNNQQALQYFSYLMDYSLNTDNFGFCNSPSIVDDKRTQRELGILAMKKTLLIKASYYQHTADAISRNLILSAKLSVSLNR